MQPWIIDANEINESNVDEFIGGVLLKNKSVADFLSSDGVRKFVVGPKGFGKTLMLKLKRQLMHTQPGYNFIPRHELISKPSGQPAILSEKELSGLVQDTVQWKNIWLTALSVTVLKSSDTKVQNVTCERLEYLIKDKLLTDPGDIFDQILSFTSRERIEVYNDYKSVLLPNLRTFRGQIALFIDNIDEYFGSVLSPKLIATSMVRGSVEGWVYSQVGLIGAAHEISGLNHHIKIYASIRSEAFEFFESSTPMGMQIEGSSIRLSYTKNDLIGIFENNISLEDDDNLVMTNGKVIENFLGRDSLIIENRFVAETERIQDYLLRHTLMRPRDIVHIGRLLADIPPNERNPDKIGQEINSAAKQIATNYITESLPHVPNLELDALLPLIKSNVLSKVEVETISNEYNKMLSEYYNTNEHFHPFCDLYRLGLLGVIEDLGGANNRVQKFAQPGQVGFLKKNVLPDSKHYLIHPVLVDHIGPRNINFKANISETNIIGHGRPWRSRSDIEYIIKGDIVGFSNVMNDPDLSLNFPEYFSDVVQRFCKKNKVNARVEQGDAVFAHAKNARNILLFCEELADELLTGPFSLKIRLAGDAGFLSYGNENSIKVQGGSPLRIAARLEPHVPASQLVVTERFKTNFDRSGQNALNLIKFSQLNREHAPSLPMIDGRFNIAKSEKEDPILHHLYFAKSS